MRDKLKTLINTVILLLQWGFLEFLAFSKILHKKKPDKKKNLKYHYYPTAFLRNLIQALTAPYHLLDMPKKILGK